MDNKRSWLDRPVFAAWPGFTIEVLLFVLILLLAFLSRFANLGARVMSHDESLHTYFSWLLFKGQGYQHTPMMHGPFQFHFLALIYFLFGDSDFTARIPAALFSVASIGMVWYWRKYLGKAGALVAGALMLISPFMLYYGRYVRNEAFVGLWGLLTLYAILRYFETGNHRYAFLLTGATVLHYATKETSFIYTAQALLFLAIYLLARVTRKVWDRRAAYIVFLILLIGGLLLGGAAVWIKAALPGQGTLSGTETASPLVPDQSASPLAASGASLSPALVVGGLAVILLLAAVGVLIYGYTWRALCRERSFDLLILLGTFVLPQLAPFPITLLGWDPLDYSNAGLLHTAYVLVPLLLLSVVIGLLWNRDLWIKNALLFYAIFTVLYTTVFTYGEGFFSGMVGSLGYWLEQQSVERGSQPWYYYLFVQIPIYEYLPALAFVLACLIGLVRKIRAWSVPAPDVAATPEPDPVRQTQADSRVLLAWWSISSLVAFTIAGEKMPWLTYHITLPMILLGGWAIGQLIDRIDWEKMSGRKPGLVLALSALFMISFSVGLLSLLGPNPPFQGKDVTQLGDSVGFVLAALTALGSAVGVGWLVRNWLFGQFARLAALAVFAILAVLTGRAAYMASYLNYDDATEYLVYAHGARGVKDVMEQVEAISRHTAGDLSVAVAYDASAPDTGVSWPVVWYLRNYTNQRSFDVPTRSLRDSAVVIVDQKNFGKIEAALGSNYQEFNYIRMWWPNQDYFSMSYPRLPDQPFPEDYACRGLLSPLKLFKSKDFTRLCNIFTDREIRAGVFQIWLNRDYSQYAEATGNTFLTSTTWEPSDKMRLYVRNDVVAMIWNYGVGPAVIAPQVDPYEGKIVDLPATAAYGYTGTGPGQFNAPRGLAFAADGSFYLADSRNHRIQHLAADGSFINSWGVFGDAGQGAAPIGTFNEPWGVAVGPDGSVYVTDTWNYRVQKFTAAGQPVTMWGSYGLGERPDSFYGPRGIAVDAQGHVYVADTGNKRIVIFDADGRYLTQFGTAGAEAGQFDEPVGVTVDSLGYVYVSDTWNQRVQSFAPATDGLVFIPMMQWQVSGWESFSIDNKPFIAVDGLGQVFITDPEGFRVIQYAPSGAVIRTWGAYGTDLFGFGLPSGIAVAPDGAVWVTDAGNNRVMRFTLP